MGAISNAANAAFADGPASSPSMPPKADIRAVFATIDQKVGSLEAGYDVSYETRAQLFADLAWSAGKIGRVFGDATVAFRGIYKKAGASGSGAWTKIGDLPEVSGLGALAFKDTVATGDIAPKAVTLNRIQDFPSGILLGRTNAGTSQLHAVGLMPGLEFIEAGAVGISDNGIPNVKLADMAAGTVKTRRPGAGAGDPTDTTHAELAVDLGLFDGDAKRPGDFPVSFTQSLAGGDPANLSSLTDADTQSGSDGQVVRLVGSELVGKRELVALELGREYPARWVVRRRVNSGDPANDALRTAIAWYDQNKIALAGGDAFTVIDDITDLVTGSGRVTVNAVIGRASGGNVTIAAPANARYARPYAQQYGSAPETDVEVISMFDGSDAVLNAPDVSDLTDRVTTLESLDAGNRLDALESAVGTPSHQSFNLLANAQAATIPVSVNLVTMLSKAVVGDGRGRSFVRAVSEPAHLNKFQSADGAWWDLVNIEGQLSSPLFFAKADGVKVAVTASIANGSPNLNAVGAAFTAADVGKSISVPKAGASGNTLNTTIAAVAGASDITLAANAATAVVSASTYLYYGTDNTAPFQGALTLLSAQGGGSLFVPAGVYWFAKDSAPLDPGMGNITLLGEGRGATVLMWEGGDVQNNYADAANKRLFENLVVAAKGYVRFEKFTLQGTLAGASKANSGGTPFWLDHYSSVELIDAEILETKTTGMSVRYANKFVSRGSRYQDIAAGAIRATDTPNVICIGNEILRCGDDSFSIHTSSAAVSLGLRPREGVIITDNIITCAGGSIKVLGGRQAKVSNNIVRFSGGGVHVYVDTSEGRNPIYDVSVCDNTIENMLYLTSGGALQNNAIGILIAGDGPRGATSTNDTIPGFYDITAGAWVYPWTYVDANTSVSTTPVAPISGVIVRGNKIMRTAPPVAEFSDYGYGRAIRSGVYFDGEVTNAAFRQNTGINFSGGGLKNAIISENIVEHLSFGILFAAPTSARDYTNVRVRGNQITDCIVRGISVATGGKTVDIAIEGGIVDCDPYREGATSNLDGTYSSSGSARGIAAFDNPGMSVSNVTFKNCSIPVYATVQVRLSKNIVWCNPLGGTGFSTSNKGIGDVPLGGNYIHVVYQGDPTLADYDQIITNPMESGTAMPSTGFYVRGYRLKNEAPSQDGNGMSIDEWRRLTTGSGHVAGTDWHVARTSHNTPAT